MSSSRRQSNGRSPLVNQQRQITSFFTKNSSPSPSPSQSQSQSQSQTPSNQKVPSSILNPNPNSTPIPKFNLSPITPSSSQSKIKKPLLVIGHTPSPAPSTPVVKTYAEEVAGKRVKIYWPLDKDWYEGFVKSYDKESGKHCIEYDDGEEESLDLGRERIEWVQGGSSHRFKRLRRGSSLFKRVVIEDEDEEMENVGDKEMEKDKTDGDGTGDDSSDEDWGKNIEKEMNEELEEEDVDLEDEEEIKEKVEVKEKGVSNNKCQGGSESRKRKATGGAIFGSGMKSESGGNGGRGGTKVSAIEAVKHAENGRVLDVVGNAPTSEASERFSAREAEKFRFLGVERRDAKRRQSKDANYDPNTLYLPHDFLKALTGAQRQWWEFKANHMDKVIFFKMGKFYELFEMDAHVGAKELNLQYMKGEQPHCGFPEKNFSMHVEKLARKGYRVLVVEQTETPEQLELRRKEKGSKDKVVKREICGVVTKGTLTEGEMLSTNPDACYIMAITEGCQTSANQNSEKIFGACVVDIATSRILMGQFRDDLDCSTLCCLLSEIRPVEVVKPSQNLSPETERVVLKYTRNPLVNELVPVTEFWDAEVTVREVRKFYNSSIEPSTCGSLNDIHSPATDSLFKEDGLGFLPDILSDLVCAGEDGSLALSALGGTLYYLRQAFLDETLLRFAKFESLPCSAFSSIAQKPYMVLDAAALENLEIYENSRDNSSSGTLYAQLNHCVTAFGKRLLKTWLARPLYHSGLIKERQDAVASCKGGNLPYALEFRKTLSRLPDMERLLARIFASSDACGRNANKVTLYEDAAKKQLQEFISVLRGCELIAQACLSLGANLEDVNSRQLHHLLTPGEGLPEINSILKHFKDAFDWVEANDSGRIIPNEGVDMEYDSACKKVMEIESALKNHLKEQRKLLGETSITYVTVGKDTYLLEVPESLCGRVPQDYELRSSKKGFYRYWTPTIKNNLKAHSEAVSEKEAALKSILQRLLRNFCEHHNKWRQLVSATAELDVLISLAIASDFYEGPTCRPVILDSTSSQDVPCLSAKGLGHPVLRSDSLGKGDFVPNDITIGGSGHASFILLTGPNMGGKSTLLRQVCLAVMLAQLGADVPAESFELSPVDKIFVRMGAKDHIMAGQSTFLTELSETASMLSLATRNSLVALDELGRGTATSDGQAIAESVLEHFVHKVQCRGLFSTHYHRLAVDYQSDPKVSLCHMGCHVGSGAGGVEEVTFLYRLTLGACPKSYGVNVARLAGLPDSVLQTAAAKSEEFEAVYGKNRRGSKGEMRAFFHKFHSVISTLSSSERTQIDSLTELQHKARALLQKN